MSGKFDMQDYVPVNERIEAFYKDWPLGALQSEIVSLTDTRVIIKAYAYRAADDERPGIGHSSLEIPGTTPFTRGSEIENAETSAWGRAIAALGFEVRRGLASAEEVRNKPEQRGAPTQPRNKGEALAALAEAGKAHGLSFAQIEAKAKGLGVERGSASIEDIMRIVAAIEQPEAASARAAPAIDTSRADGLPDTSGTAATTPEASVGESTEPPAALTDAEILAAAGPGAELVPPEPGTPEYRALPPQEKAEAKQYHAGRTT